MPRQPILADFIAAFGDDPGVLPDGLVLGSCRQDWQRVLQVIDDNGWDATWGDNGESVVSGDFDDPSRSSLSFALRPMSTVQVNFFPGGEEILFDIDLREITSQEALDALASVISQLGCALDLPVALSSEGDFEDVVIRYDPTSGEFSLRAPRQS